MVHGPRTTAFSLNSHTPQDWYIDGVLEELDSPREFYYSAADKRLFYFHNATAGQPPPATWTWEAPALTTLINMTGTQSAPLTGVSITGVTFTAAAASFLGDHGEGGGGGGGCFETVREL